MLRLTGSWLRTGRYEAEGPEELEGMVNDLRRAMEMASICGLGMVGANPLGSVLQLFRDDVDAYAPTKGRPMTTSYGASPKQNGEKRR